MTKLENDKLPAREGCGDVQGAGAAERSNPSLVKLMANVGRYAQPPADTDTGKLLEMITAARVSLEEVITPDEFLFEWEGVGFCPKDNIVSLKAPAKVGKTFMLTAFATAFLTRDYGGLRSFAGRDSRALFVDTEQSRNDTRKLLHRIAAKTTADDTSRMEVLNIRNIPAASRLSAIEIESDRITPELIVIDGIADLIPGMDYNDNKAAEEVIGVLLGLAEKHHAVIICAIHQNNKDDFATGWLGRILKQKCAHELAVKREGRTARRTLTCADTRSRELKDIPFDIVESDDDLGEVRIVGTTTFERERKEELMRHHREKLMEIGIDPPMVMSRTKLNALVAERSGCASNTARQIVTRAIKAGALRADGDSVIFDEFSQA